MDNRTDLALNTDTENFDLTEITGSIPCDFGPLMCKSRMTQNASYLMTHKGADTGCTRMACEACIEDFMDWLSRCIIENGPNSFRCAGCRSSHMHYTVFIIRPLGG